ncbi:uncharacterized protein [Engystomops pustulosus]|uniref:uncharacterized protein isoform X2 n=1 Tax=Engystomops pustulosus TaxID=76066 RepID=UPI003AFAFEAF
MLRPLCTGQLHLPWEQDSAEARRGAHPVPRGLPPTSAGLEAPGTGEEAPTHQEERQHQGRRPQSPCPEEGGGATSQTRPSQEAHRGRPPQPRGETEPDPGAPEGAPGGRQWPVHRGIRKVIKNKADGTAPGPGEPADENRRALWSLENVLVSLLQHLAEAPLTSRTQKQKTTRLLNQTAEIVSVLTGEDWTVVKKNAHISKFYNMIREVPIKVGDVAVFFSMDEWDYIEDHEENYKHVMVEEPPKSLDYTGVSDGGKTEPYPDTRRHKFEDIDFGGPFDFLQSPETLPPDKEEVRREDLQVLEMSCSSDDDEDEEDEDPPPNTRTPAPADETKRKRDDLDIVIMDPFPDEPKIKIEKDEDMDIVIMDPSPDDDDEDIAEPDTPETRDPSPERSDTPARDCSPERNETPERDPSPERCKTPERDPSPDRSNTLERDPSPERCDTPERDPSPERCDTPERDPSPERCDTPERDPSPERCDTPERDPSPERCDTPERDPSAERCDTPERDPSAERCDTPERDPSAERCDTPERDPSAERDPSPVRSETPETRDPSPKRCDTPEGDPSPGRSDSPEAGEQCPDSPSSDLWIAQDGTTSSTWMPQDDPRPKGRNCFKYGKNAGRIQCPVSLCGTTTICLPELPLTAGPEHRCDLCDLSFPDKYELDLHQLTHSKKRRL